MLYQALQVLSGPYFILYRGFSHTHFYTSPAFIAILLYTALQFRRLRPSDIKSKKLDQSSQPACPQPTFLGK